MRLVSSTSHSTEPAPFAVGNMRQHVSGKFLRRRHPRILAPQRALALFSIPCSNIKAVGGLLWLLRCIPNTNAFLWQRGRNRTYGDWRKSVNHQPGR